MSGDTRTGFHYRDDDHHDGPVTAIISREIRVGRRHEAAYEHWLDGISRSATTVPGFVGVNISRRSEGRKLTYVSIIRFSSYAHLEDWERSQSHKDWLAKIPLHAIASEAHVQRSAGLELWFAASNSQPLAQPARHKLALVLIVLVFSMLTVLGPLFAWLLSTMNPHLRMLLVITAQVMFMTYVVLPWVTRVLSGWLYAKPSLPPIDVMIDRIAWLSGIRRRRSR